MPPFIPRPRAVVAIEYAHLTEQIQDLLDELRPLLPAPRDPQ